MAPKCKIMPLKSLGDNGSGNVKDIGEAILYAADNGADIITMSLGTPVGSLVLRQCINYAVDKGCALFCAAGNSGQSKNCLIQQNIQILFLLVRLVITLKFLDLVVVMEVN